MSLILAALLFGELVPLERTVAVVQDSPILHSQVMELLSEMGLASDGEFREVSGSRAADHWAWHGRFFAGTADETLATLLEVADELGIPKSTVSLIEKTALAKLRAALEAKGLGPTDLDDAPEPYAPALFDVLARTPVLHRRS